jgi:hypothetical protein
MRISFTCTPRQSSLSHWLLAPRRCVPALARCPTPARGPPTPQRTRWAEKDWRLLFQKASTKILLYLMAMGHTVAPAGQHSTARTSQQAQHG